MTEPIDIEFARTYLKADGDDDDLITAQILSARNVCEDYCNRKFYDDADSQQEDFTDALTDRVGALLNQKNALGAITGREQDDDDTRALIRAHYIEVLAAISRRIHGIVIDDAINAAILITLGHLYKNREDNLATGNNVVQVPVGAQRILQSKLWIGKLVDGGVGIDPCYVPPEGADPMTVKFDKFKAALIKLCEEHDVVIGSELYDSPAVWDRIDHEPVIYQDCLTDKTQSQRPLPGVRK